jgi:hypothetical protein
LNNGFATEKAFSANFMYGFTLPFIALCANDGVVPKVTIEITVRAISNAVYTLMIRRFIVSTI